MPTLVQQPAIADTQVSQLQAVAEPVKVESSGLSSFIMGILPVATKFVADKQEEGKDYNLALGMNDELNGVARDVSLLDRKYYKHGRDLQTIQTAMTVRDSSTASQLKVRLEANPELMDNPDELLAEYEQGNKAIVDSIFESDLPSDIKVKSYEAQLQSHAAQIKQVRGVIKEAAIGQEIKGRSSRNESFLGKVLNSDTTTEDMDLAYGQFKSAAQAAISKREDLTQDQKADMYAKEITVALDNAVTLVANNTTLGTATNLQIIGKLKSVINKHLQNPDVSADTYSKLVTTQDKLNTLDTKLGAARDKITQYNHSQSLLDYEVGTSSVDEQVFRDKVSGIQAEVASGAKTPEQGEREINDYVRLYNKALAAKVAAEDEPLAGVDIVEGNMSKSHFVDMYESTPEEYDKRVMSVFMRRNSESPSGRVQAGLDALDWTDKGGGGEYNPALRRQAANLVMNNLVQFLNDPNSPKTEGFGRADQNWNLLVGKAQVYIQSSAPHMVDDLLGDTTLTDAQRMQLRTVLTKGGTLKEAIQSFQTANDTQANIQSFKAGVDKWDVKSMGMSNWFGVSSNLVGWKGSTTGSLLAVSDRPNAAPSSIIRQTQANNIRNIARNSDSELSARYGVLGDDAAISELARAGQIIPSRRRYNATTLNASTAAVVHNIPSIPEGVRGQYVSVAMDAIANQYAVSANVDTNNVFITTHDRNNKYVYISHLDKSGGMSDPVLRPVGDVIRIADTAYKAQVQGAASKPFKVTKPMNGGVELSSGDAWGRGGGVKTKDTFTYDSRAKLGSITLTAKDSAHRGRKYTVQVPAKASEMVNGNADLTMGILSHLGVKEGLHMRIEGVTDKVSGKVSENGGLQISVTKNPKYRKALQAAEGNAQAIMNVQADFMAEYFKELQSDARKVGIPVATQKMYPEAHKRTQIYLADLTYHGGNSTRSAVRSTLTQSTVYKGMAELQRLSAYKSSSADRRKFLEQALFNHYRNVGKN